MVEIKIASENKINDFTSEIDKALSFTVENQGTSDLTLSINDAAFDIPAGAGRTFDPIPGAVYKCLIIGTFAQQPGQTNKALIIKLSPNC